MTKTRRPRGSGHIRTLGGDTQYHLIYDEGRQRLAHRVVMERVLGRKLRTDEVVHHRDENGLNNDPANLEIMDQTKHRQEHGGPRRWDLDIALQMRASGATIASIAKHFAVSESTVNKVLKRRGHSTAAPPRVLKFDRELALARHRDGMCISEIARQAGVSPPSITKALRRLGVL